MITDSIVQSTTITTWLSEAEREIKARSDYLTQLDAAIGDGDHGINMRRGFDAVGKALAGVSGPSSASGIAGQGPLTSSGGDALPPGRLLILAGKTLVSTVGGASGPLWGSALRRAGRALGDAPSFDAEQLADALDEAVKGVVELGAAAPGDKTMVDALAPAAQVLRESLGAGAAAEEALAAAADAARRGAEATVPMQARKGRASYLGERSIGHQDPGATSAAIIIAALHSSVAREG